MRDQKLFFLSKKYILTKGHHQTFNRAMKSFQNCAVYLFFSGVYNVSAEDLLKHSTYVSFSDANVNCLVKVNPMNGRSFP